MFFSRINSTIVLAYKLQVLLLRARWDHHQAAGTLCLEVKNICRLPACLRASSVRLGPVHPWYADRQTDRQRFQLFVQHIPYLNHHNLAVTCFCVVVVVVVVNSKQIERQLPGHYCSSTHLSWVNGLFYLSFAFINYVYNIRTASAVARSIDPSIHLLLLSSVCEKWYFLFILDKVISMYEYIVLVYPYLNRRSTISFVPWDTYWLNRLMAKMIFLLSLAVIVCYWAQATFSPVNG